MPSLRQLLSLLVPALLALDASATSHYVDLSSPNPSPPYTTWPTAATNIQDAVDVAMGDDEILVTNGVYSTGGNLWNGITNRVRALQRINLRSVNGPAVTIISGYQVPGTTNGSSAVRCVGLVSGGTLTGFTLTNGATAVANNPNGAGGGLFCYAPTTISNCVITGNAAHYAGGGIYCFSVTAPVLTGCTISSNLSYGSGGGIYAGTCSNCTLIGNSAREGGGAAGSVLNNCVLIGNIASNGTTVANGGGASGGALNNCLVVGNKAYNGGGAYWSYLTNCTVVSNSATLGGGVWPILPASSSPSILNSIIFYNTASNGPNWYGGGNASYCCTTPDISPGSYALFSITNAPPLFDQNAGSFRLQSNSPCINAGNNSSSAGPDLDGNPRIVGGTVDIGAYEFQSPTSILSYGWAQQYGLPTDGSADFADTDGDGMNNWQEWMTATDPTTSLSVLKMFSPSNSPPGLLLSWQSTSGRRYFLQRATNLAAQPTFVSIASNILAFTNSTAYNDTTATNPGPYFYRVGLQ